MKKSLALVLMQRILEVVEESGANMREAQSALCSAQAMLPEMDLPTAPTMTFDAAASRLQGTASR